MTAQFPETVTAEHAARLADPARLKSLRGTGLVETPQEAAFDRAVSLVKRVTGAPTALFSLVGDDRQVFKAQLGLALDRGPVSETPLTQSFCQYVVSHSMPLMIEDARLHPILSKNGATTDLNVIAYLGVPVFTARGHALGSLCAIDNVPRAWSPEDVDALTEIARFVETEIALRDLVSDRQLLIQELNHRSRNIFALVNGLVRMGSREETDVAAYAKALQSRLTTLAAAQNLIMPLAAPEQGTRVALSLDDLCNELLSPYADAKGISVAWSGPPVSIASGASAYLALAINELATNAIKYGALSAEGGRLSLTWSVTSTDLVVTWNETFAGRETRESTRRGFGSDLLDLCISSRLEGQMETVLTDSELRRTMTIPLGSLLE